MGRRAVGAGASVLSPDARRRRTAVVPVTPPSASPGSPPASPRLPGPTNATLARRAPPEALPNLVATPTDPIQVRFSPLYGDWMSASINSSKSSIFETSVCFSPLYGDWMSASLTDVGYEAWVRLMFQSPLWGLDECFVSRWDA